jgi:hypothetical protein
MKSRSRITFIAILFAVLAAGTGAADAQTDATRPVLYRLEKGSTYQFGCFEPCLCPILDAVPVRGTFVLTFAGFDGLFTTYKVTDVNWTASLGDPELRITGSGTYTTGGEFAVQQRLVLDLKVGDQPVEHFDSGLVTGSRVPFPGIDLRVSIHGEYCFDTVIEVNALPVPPDQIHPYRLGPSSTFTRGCFDPCDCPVGAPQPIDGTFALVDLRQDPLFTEFAVVDVRWVVSSSDGTTATGIPVRGFGTYRFGGEVAVQQQLALDLTVGAEDPAHFDSGLVAGGAGFPRIDTTISINGAVCFDTVIDVHARPLRRMSRRPAARLF